MSQHEDLDVQLLAAVRPIEALLKDLNTKALALEVKRDTNLTTSENTQLEAEIRRLIKVRRELNTYIAETLANPLASLSLASIN